MSQTTALGRGWLAATIVAGVVALAGCASKPPGRPASGGIGNAGSASSATAAPAPANAARPGAYYKDDGPAASLPADIDRIADAQPRSEPLHRFANRPYSVFGVEYVPLTMLSPLRQRGMASWYGRKFHGQKTAIGETYDMFAMTAAHPTAPLPSFARVTNVRSNQSVIVRINDRGPFHPGRIVDLSYAAAHRLGLAQGGSGEVEFELLLPPYAAVAVAAAAPAAPSRQAEPPPVTPVATVPEAAPLTTADAERGGFYVQLGAFGNFANAQTFQQRISLELESPPRVQQIDALFRVRLGPFATREAAEAARDRAQVVLGARLLITSGSAR